MHLHTERKCGAANVVMRFMSNLNLNSAAVESVSASVTPLICLAGDRLLRFLLNVPLFFDVLFPRYKWNSLHSVRLMKRPGEDHSQGLCDSNGL